ncbi:hypothetical protein MXL54_04635 [Enterobacteriaceae bacterium G50]|nr:hypothetical protein [Enterobacteriaceae bacterium G50]
MKSITSFLAVVALSLTSVLATNALAADNTRVEAGSNIDTAVGQNHIDVSHAFDAENLTAGNLQ